MKIAGKSYHKLIILLISSLLLSFHLYTEGSRAFALSVEEEKILGQKFLAKVHKYFDLVDDDFVNEYINGLGHYLISPLKTKHFAYRFYVIKDNALNAFAAPGGYIFIFSGLIEVMDEVDELAAVTSHEIGHVSGRHLAHRIEQTKKIGLATMAGMLAGVLIGGKAAGAIMTGSMAASIQKQLSYSRNDERHADQLGFKYMDQAGFDPSGMIATLKKIQQGHWLGTDRIPSYLLTHPGGPERISNVESMMTHYIRKPENRKVAQFRRLFPLYKTVLRAKYMEPREAERLFNRLLEKDPDSTMAHLGLGIVWKERSEYDLAVDHLQGALKGQPDSLLVLKNLGEAYQLKGQNGEAIGVLEKVLKIDDRDKSALFLMALSYQNLEEYPKAVRLYERLTSMQPVKEEVFYNLGVSYGRQNKLALAHYNFGLYFEKLGKKQKAGFHFQKAKDLSNNDPALKRRIQKARKDAR